MPNHKQWLTNKDFWAGVMFMAIGCLSIGTVLVEGYPIGLLAKMGPGYFPVVLGGALIIMGGILAVKAYGYANPLTWTGDIRALIILPLALVIFGYSIDRVGLVPALVFIVISSSLAFKKFRWVEILLLTVGFVGIITYVFVELLGVPYRLFRF